MAYDCKKEFKGPLRPNSKTGIHRNTRYYLRRCCRIGRSERRGRRLQAGTQAPVRLLMHSKDIEKGRMAAERLFQLRGASARGPLAGRSGRLRRNGSVRQERALKGVPHPPTGLRDPRGVQARLLPRHWQEARTCPAIERSDLRIVRFSEGSCAQIMHKGPCDDEPATVARLANFVKGPGTMSRHRERSRVEPARDPRHARPRRSHPAHPPASRNLSWRPASDEAREPQDGNPSPRRLGSRLDFKRLPHACFLTLPLTPQHVGI